MFKGGVLPAFDARQHFLDHLGQRVALAPPPSTVPIAEEAVTKNGVKPAAQITFDPAQAPAERARSSVSWTRSSARSRSPRNNAWAKRRNPGMCEVISELDEILRTFSSLLRITQIETSTGRPGFAIST